MNYREYLQSEQWVDVRRRWVESGRPTYCGVCGDVNYQLHHKTYERLGSEELDDLEPLCEYHHRERHGLTNAGEAWAAFRKVQHGYRKTFVDYFGPFEAHFCYFCGERLDGHVGSYDSTATVIHHQDEDRTNNHPLNLKPAHHGCHSAYHGKKRMSAEIRARLRERNRELSLQQWQDPEKRARILAATQRLVVCPICGRELKGNAALSRHLDACELSNGTPSVRKGRSIEEKQAARTAGIRRAFANPELRQAIRDRVSGKRNPFYGQKHDPATLTKMREGHKTAPRASCVVCRKVMTMSNLQRHVDACHDVLRAQDFLVAELADGPQLIRAIQARAARRGFKEWTVRLAAGSLGLERRSAPPLSGKRVWALADYLEDPPARRVLQTKEKETA